MGEIKSTMDIIMEKTKGLTMSEEEKVEFKQQELSGKARGLIQKFIDGILDLNTLKSEIDLLSDYPRDLVEQAIVEASIPHIELGEKNEPILRIFNEIVGVDIGPIVLIEKAYNEGLEREKKVREESLKEKFKDMGVSGSAVIPNLEADQDWKQYLSEEHEAFRTTISSRLKSA